MVRKYEEEAIATGESDFWPSFDNYPPRGKADEIGTGAEGERQSKRAKASV